MNQNCTLSDKELVDRLQEINRDLCKSNGRSWRLCVPPDHNRDPDLLINEICKRLLDRNAGITKP